MNCTWGKSKCEDEEPIMHEALHYHTQFNVQQILVSPVSFRTTAHNWYGQNCTGYIARSGLVDACMYLHTVHRYIHTFIHTIHAYICTCKHAHIHRYIYTCICTCVHMYVCAYIRTYVCMYLCVHICMYVCMYVYIYVFMQPHTYVSGIYNYTYVCTHIMVLLLFYS